MDSLSDSLFNVSFPSVLPDSKNKDIALDLLTRKEFFRYRSVNPENDEKDDEGDYFFHQKIVHQYLLSQDRLFLIHEPGSGKSRTALGIVNSILPNGILHNIYKRIVISTPNEKLGAAWKENQEYMNAEINGIRIEVVTHSRLSRFDPKLYPRTIFIIDEVHLLANINTKRRDNPDEYKRNDTGESMQDIYDGIWNILQRSSNPKVILLTATPFQNSVEDFYPLMNLVLTKDEQISSRGIDEDALANKMLGRISFVRNIYKGIELTYGANKDFMNNIQSTQLKFGSSSSNLNGMGVETICYLDLPESNPATKLSYSIPIISGIHCIQIIALENSTSRFFNRDILSIDWNNGGTCQLISRSNMEEDNSNGVLLNILYNSTMTEGKWVLDVTVLDELTTGFSLIVTIPSLFDMKLDIPSFQHGYPCMLSIMGPSHTGRIKKIISQSKKDRLIFNDVQQSIIFRDASVKLISAQTLNMNTLASYSRIFFNLICMFIMTAPVKIHDRLRERWDSMPTMEPTTRRLLDGLLENAAASEPGKNIFFTYYRDEYFGIEFVGHLLSQLGYERLEKNTDTSTNSPRFVISPEDPTLRAKVNDSENWDGSKVQIILFTGAGAKGFGYFDVRHIHIIPTWSPSENTQAIYRGIRSFGHENIRKNLNVQKVPVRIYVHTIIPNPGQSVVSENFYEVDSEIQVEGIKYRQDLPEGSGSPGMQYVILDEERNTDIDQWIDFDANVNRISLSSIDTTSGKIYYTLNGIVYKHFPLQRADTLQTLRIENPELIKYTPIVTRNGYEVLSSPHRHVLAVSLEKDREFSRIRRMVRIRSMDCDLLYNRNHLPSSFDGTSECDYQLCAYQCFSELDESDFMGQDTNPSDGSDPRITRYLSPMTNYRKTTHDDFIPMSEKRKREIMEQLKNDLKKNGRIFFHQFLADHLEKNVTDGQLINIVLSLIHDPSSSTPIYDLFGRPSRISFMGGMIYLIPVEVGGEFLRELYPESQFAGKYLYTDLLNLSFQGLNHSEIKKPVETTLEDIRDIYQTDTSKLISLMKSDFRRFVKVVEYAYINGIIMNNLQDTVAKTIMERFGIYFATLKKSDFDKNFYVGGGTVGIEHTRVEKMTKETIVPVQNDEESIHVHFLWHFFPSNVEPRGFISTKSPIKVWNPTAKIFRWATDTEQRLGVQAIKKRLKTLEMQYTLKSRESNFNGVFGYIDYRALIYGLEPLDYLKIIVPGEAANDRDDQDGGGKDMQGRACKSYKVDQLGDIISNFTTTAVPSNTRDKCRFLESLLSQNNMLY